MFAALLVPYILWADSGNSGNPDNLGDSSRWQRRALAGALFAACFLLVLLPWTFRVNQHHDHFVILSTTSYYNLHYGNAPDREVAKARYYNSKSTTSERELAARTLALDHIKQRLPWWPIEKIGSESPRLLTPNSFGVFRLLLPDGAWRYRFTWSVLDSTASRYTMATLGMLACAAVLLTGAAGLMLAERSRVRGLLAVLIASHLFASFLTFASSRFRRSDAGVDRRERVLTDGWTTSLEGRGPCAMLVGPRLGGRPGRGGRCPVPRSSI